MALAAVESFSAAAAGLAAADGKFAPRGPARGRVASIGGGGRRIGAVRRKAGSGSSFLGDVRNLDSEWNGKVDFAGERRELLRVSARRPDGARAGGVFFIPIGPGGRRAGDAGTYARREWEKRQRAQQAKLREIIEREIKARSEAARGKTRGDSQSTTERRKGGMNYEFSLLRELEKRLRVEEEFARGERGQDVSPPAAANGGEEKEQKDDEKKIDLGASTYDLMKELEKRLRTESENRTESRSSRTESPEDQREGANERRERGRRDRFATGEFSPLYEQMREWKRETNERRSKLERMWNKRREDFIAEQAKGAEGERRRSTDRRRRREASVGQGQEREVEIDTSGDVPQKDADAIADGEATAEEAGPKNSQSQETVVYLKNEANGAEIYLVGTSHVSKKSTEEVKDVIERVKPDFVMVELCRKRYERMSDRHGRERRGGPLAFVEQMARMLTNGNVGGFGRLVGVGLASFYELLSYRGLQPGKEFQVAIEEGKKAGAKIVLGDQDIELTLKRLGEFDLRMSMQDVFKMFGQRVPDDIADILNKDSVDSDNDLMERMRNRKVVRRFNEEMGKGAPAIYKILMEDRNEVMVKALRNLKGKVVAVVGMAHMDGMEQLWREANDKFLRGTSSGSEN